MIALGIDVSTRLLAVAAIDDTGDHHTVSIPLDPSLRGAQRLTAARGALLHTLARDTKLHANAAMVEIPWAKRGSSFALLSMAGVCLEVTQHALRGCVVMDVPTQTWKRESVGNGNASKDAVMVHARGLGYTGGSQDEADALCMAQAAMERLLRTVGRDDTVRAAA